MKLFDARDHPPAPVDPNTFTGTATLARADGVCDDPAVNVYTVAFDAGARTDWHIHTGPQLLLIVSGCCRIQTEGEPVREIETGGTACVAPGEKHWHGASADAPMTHVAININATTRWLDKVTDQQYDGRP